MSGMGILLVIVLVICVAIFTYRAGRLYWEAQHVRGAIGTWLLALAAVGVPLWFLWYQS